MKSVRRSQRSKISPSYQEMSTLPLLDHNTAPSMQLHVAEELRGRQRLLEAKLQ